MSVVCLSIGLCSFTLSCASFVLQGHFQIALNRERCPLLQKRLSWGMRILYMSGVWSYIVGLTSTPTFIIIPLVRPPPHVISFACIPVLLSRQQHHHTCLQLCLLVLLGVSHVCMLMLVFKVMKT